jgi:hydroxymethylglutaryl-CoA lyase
VDRLLDRLLDAVPQDQIALHFHDTYGRATDNALAGYARGVTVFDASAGGVGGCPYAPGAAGNVSTQDLARALREAGAEVSIDLAKVDAATRLLAGVLRRPLRTSGGPAV